MFERSLGLLERSFGLFERSLGADRRGCLRVVREIVWAVRGDSWGGCSRDRLGRFIILRQTVLLGGLGRYGQCLFRDKMTAPVGGRKVMNATVRTFFELRLSFAFPLEARGNLRIFLPCVLSWRQSCVYGGFCMSPLYRRSAISLSPPQ